VKEIYILEDDKDIGFILKYILFEEGYDVSVYETLSEIRCALQSHLPNLLLMDVRLPDGNGMDLCAELKQQKKLLLPVIMMSAHWDLKKGGNCGADEFIAKPFDLDQMVSKVSGYLGGPC
jgi:DNA-binding response OmpR family regulator